MKTKQIVGIASALIFGAALFMVVAVAGILYLGSLRENNTAGAVALTSSNSESTPPNFVALYDNTTQQIVRINLSDGSNQNFDLGLSPNNSYISGRAISRDGRFIAYCAVVLQDDVYVTNSLVVRDLEAGQNTFVKDFGNIPGCNAGAFSPDGNYVAVGFVFNSPIMGQMDFPDEPNWALRVFDVQSGNVAYELSANSANVPDFEAMDDYWFEEGISPMPSVLDFGETSIHFLAFPFVGRDGPPAAPSFRWDFATGSLTQLEGLGNNGATLLASTGEIAYPYHNPAFPAAQAMGPIPLANEIRLSDANGSRTIYRDTEHVIASLSFVNGGRQLAVLFIPNANPDKPDEIAVNRYILINRDGSVENLNSASQYYAPIFPTNSGFGVLRIEQRTDAASGNFSNFHQVLRYENGELTVLWELDAGMNAMGQVWMGVFGATPQSIAPNLTPFVGID